MLNIESILGYILGGLLAIYLIQRKTNILFFIFLLLIVGVMWTFIYFLVIDIIRSSKQEIK